MSKIKLIERDISSIPFEVRVRTCTAFCSAIKECAKSLVLLGKASWLCYELFQFCLTLNRYEIK